MFYSLQYCSFTFGEATDSKQNRENAYTVEPVLGDHPFCPAKTVAQDRWSLITGRTKIMFYRLSDLCTLLHTLAVGIIEAGMALA